MGHETRLKELRIELPPAGKVLGVYRPVFVLGNLAYTSGHGPVGGDGTGVCGRLGDDLDQAAGYEAARRTGLAMLASLRGQLGTLDAIRRLVKTVGYVQATADFKAHPSVINGFSELMRDVFGPETGVGARSAMGVASLPAGWCVEIEAVFELEKEN